MTDDFDALDGVSDVVPENEGSGPFEDNQNPVQRDPRTGKFIPIERFNQVYPWQKELREFGKTPAEVKQQLQTFREWQKAVEEQRQQASMPADEKAAMERQLAIQKELFKVMPGLKSLEKIEQLEKELAEFRAKDSERTVGNTLKEASAKFSNVLKANKIDARYQDKIEEYIVSQMTEEERQEFVEGNFEIAERIFDNELKEGIFSMMRAKTNLPAPPLRNTPGGTPPKGKAPGAKSLTEAHAEAWSRMNG